MKAILLAALLAGTAYADTVTIVVPDTCASWAASGTTNAPTLTCTAPSGTTPTPPPAPGDKITCAGYSSTTNISFRYDIGKGQQIQTVQGSGAKPIIVAVFTTPTKVGTPYISVADNAPNTTGFTMAISPTPCAFPPAWTAGDSQSASFNYNVAQPNTTYYINVTSLDPVSIKLTAR